MPLADSKKRKAYMQAWRAANPEKVAEARRKRSAYLKAWRAAHPRLKSPRSSFSVERLSKFRLRAEKLGVPFNLTAEDMNPPEVCPVLGKRMGPGLGTNWRASLDRIIPELGYVKGNVLWVSMKANQIKSNATADDLVRVAEFYAPLIEMLAT